MRAVMTNTVFQAVFPLVLLAALMLGTAQAQTRQSPSAAPDRADRQAEEYLSRLFSTREGVEAGATWAARRKWLDLPYATLSPSEKLDIYLPDRPAGRLPDGGDGPFPVIVAIHGGSFSRGDKRDFQIVPVMAGLDRGYAVVSINYRLSGEATFPAQIKDVEAAIRWIRAHAREYSLNPEKIAVWGDSAGGNLAALAGTSGLTDRFRDAALGNPDQAGTVDAVVDWYGPVDFLTLGHIARLEKVGNKMIGKTSLEAPELYLAANPATYAAPDNPPFLIQHGDADQVIPVGQSIDFAAKLKKILGKDKVTLDIVSGADHLDQKFTTRDNITKVLDFLDKYMK